jgi:methionyl-tRNA formyltransferase
VHDGLAELGPSVIERVLASHAAGALVGAAQDEARATRARKLSKSEATVDLAEVDAAGARARINGLNSWPGCTVLVGDLPVKLLRVEECEAPRGETGVLGADGLNLKDPDRTRTRAHHPVGGKPMSVAEFLNGRPRLAGSAVRPVPAAPA